MDNCLRFLGLARRAGALEIGEDGVASAAHAGRARVLLTASDAAERLLRRAESLAGDKRPHIRLPYTKEQLGAEIGRGTPGLVAITDIGMASSFTEKLAAAFPGQYEDAAQALAARDQKARRRRQEAKAHERNVKTGKRRIQK